MAQTPSHRFSATEDTLLQRALSRLDWSLVGAVLLLAITGWLFIFSATRLDASGPGYLWRQGVAFVVGIFLLVFFAALPYQVLRTYARWIYVVGLILLVGVLIFGVRLRGSRSWFDLGVFYFQPVELVRVALTISLAAYADARFRDMREWPTLAAPFGMTGLYLALILIQPDLSSALVLAPMVGVVLFAAGAPLDVLVGVTVVGALALGIPLAATYFSLTAGRREHGPILSLLARAFLDLPAFFVFWGCVCVALCLLWWFIRQWRVFVPGIYLAGALVVVAAGVGGSFVVKSALKDYQRKRLIAFVDPALDPLGAGYNILQSEIALGSGRFFGKGYLSGSQSKLGFLPEKHTDFVFSLIGEEMGFFGALVVLGLYFWVVWRAFDIALVARDRFGRFLALGIGALFASAGLINIGMVMGLMPVTGLPLPFLSYGGSGLVGAFLGVGLLLSVHLRRFIL